MRMAIFSKERLVWYLQIDLKSLNHSCFYNKNPDMKTQKSWTLYHLKITFIIKIFMRRGFSP